MSLILISTNVFCWKNPFNLKNKKQESVELNEIQELIEKHEKRKNEDAKEQRKIKKVLGDLIAPLTSWGDIASIYGEEDAVVVREIIEFLDYQRLRKVYGKVVRLKLSFEDLKKKALNSLKAF